MAALKTMYLRIREDSNTRNMYMHAHNTFFTHAMISIFVCLHGLLDTSAKGADAAR